MVYRYTRTSLLLQGTIIVLLIVLGLMSSDWFLRAFCVLVAVVLFKDLLHCYGAEFSLDDTGLLEKSRFKTKYCMRWDALQIISKTQVNRRWIMLRGTGKSYYMIKPYIQNYEGLAREVILYLKDHRIKGVVIHEDLIKRLQMNNIRLNQDGLIKFD